MIIELDPPHGAGTLRLGMTIEEASDALTSIDAPSREFRREPQGPPGLIASRSSGLVLFVYVDELERVDAIELALAADATDDVTFRGLSLLTLPVREVADGLALLTAVEQDDEGYELTAPDLLLAFWRSVLPASPDDPAGRCFEGVLVARPGYYDTDDIADEDLTAAS